MADQRVRAQRAPNELATADQLVCVMEEHHFTVYQIQTAVWRFADCRRLLSHGEDDAIGGGDASCEFDCFRGIFQPKKSGCSCDFFFF